MTTQNYADLVARAEEAVAAVKDPELKRIAFQKVIDDLLGSNSTKEQPRRKATSKKRSATGNKRKAPSQAGPQAHVNELANEDFFKKPKTISNVKAELENRGHHIPLTSLSGPLQKLCQRKVLRRQKLNASGKKQNFAYSNW